MTAINTATKLTSVPWDSDPLAFAPTPPGIGVNWDSGIDEITEEISSAGAFAQTEYFMILIATQDATTYAGEQAFDIMEDISDALNETSITIGSVANAGVCRPHLRNGVTKQCVAGHGGHALYLMFFKVERVVE
jgi:hypothetical protein